MTTSSSGSSGGPARSGRSGARSTSGTGRSRTLRADDYIFEGYELGDALEAANGALSDDLEISNGDGIVSNAGPFQEEELLKPLERWFFGHRP